MSETPRMFRSHLRGMNIDEIDVDNFIPKGNSSMKIRTYLTMLLLVTAASGRLVLAQNGRGNGDANKPQTPAHTTGKPAADTCRPRRVILRLRKATVR